MPKGFPDSFTLSAIQRLGRKGSRKGGRARGPKLNPRVITYKLVNLTLYKPIIQFEIRSRYGMVDQHLHGIGNRVVQKARLQAGFKTGRLRNSMRISHLRVRGEAAVKIGAYTNYALMHHQGTKPHLITPNKPGGTLVFRKGAKIVHTKLVRHPGTKPNRYLTDQLRKEILR